MAQEEGQESLAKQMEQLMITSMGKGKMGLDTLISKYGDLFLLLLLSPPLPPHPGCSSQQIVC